MRRSEEAPPQGRFFQCLASFTSNIKYHIHIKRTAYVSLSQFPVTSLSSWAVSVWHFTTVEKSMLYSTS